MLLALRARLSSRQISATALGQKQAGRGFECVGGPELSCAVLQDPMGRRANRAEGCGWDRTSERTTSRFSRGCVSWRDCQEAHKRLQTRRDIQTVVEDVVFLTERPAEGGPFGSCLAIRSKV